MKCLKLFACILVIVLLSGCTVVKTKDKENYRFCLSACYGAEEFLPDADVVADDDSFTYKYYVSYELFGGEGIVVTQSLTDETFEECKEEVMNSYMFLSEPVWDDYTQRYVISEVEFEFDGYSFFVIENNSIVYDPPKLFGMIAFSEKEKKIKYFSFYCQDLDYIEDMAYFVEDEFPGWEK